jgi:hypothetical protein
MKYLFSRSFCRLYMVMRDSNHVSLEDQRSVLIDTIPRKFFYEKGPVKA